jgi:hypothetical protein
MHVGGIYARAAPRSGCKGALDYNSGSKRGSSSPPSGVPAMAAPQSSIITRVAYGISQLPRVAWYLGHGLALRRLAEVARRNNGAKARRRVHTSAPVPDRSRLYADMARLFLQDLAKATMLRDDRAGGEGRPEAPRNVLGEVALLHHTDDRILSGRLVQHRARGHG